MDITRRNASLGVLLLGLTVAGCSASAPPPAAEAPAPPAAPPPPPPPPVNADVVVTNDANGTTVHLRPDQKLVVRLSGASGSTGYAWRLVAVDARHLGKPVSTFESATPPPAPGQHPMLGGGGTAVFTVTPKRPGPSYLRLALYPPGRGRPAAQTFRLNVVIDHN